MTSNEHYGEKTSAFEVAKAFASRIAGKTVLVTGATLGGIGDATVRAFAHGVAFRVIITGRDDAKLSESTKVLSEAYPNTIFRPLKLNLSVLAEVAKAAQEIMDDTSILEIDIVIANAARSSLAPERSVTSDGIEEHLAVNHLAHFLFITKILPKIQAAAKKNPAGETRIVAVSSLTGYVTPFRFSDWNLENKPVPDEEKPNPQMLEMLTGSPEPKAYDGYIAYGQSKTANVLFAVQINKLFAKSGIYAFSLHPGLVVSNGWLAVKKGIPEELVAQIGYEKKLDEGAATTLVAALDPALKPESGVYLKDCQVDKTVPLSSTDPNAAQRLWELSEEIISKKLQS